MKQVQYTLPDNWAWKTLDDVSEKITDGTHHSPKNQYAEWEPGRFKYITSKNIKNNGMKLDDISFIGQDVHDEIYARCAPEFEDQLLTKDGAMTGTCCLNELNEPFSLLSSVALIKQKRLIIFPKYLNYYLQSHVGQNFLLGDISGAAITRTNIKKLKSTPVPLAPFSEQKRIVEKLDALLSRIDTAIEHLQESVTLTDALYASYVNTLLTPPENQPDSRNLSSSAGSWEWKKIEEVFTITSGKNLTKKDMEENGEYSVYGGNGIAGRFSDFNLHGTNIIIGRVGALCGNVRLISEKIWLTDNAFFIKEYKIDISKEFLAKVLDALNLGSTANKAAQPVISYKSIKELTIPYPPLSQQVNIVNDLNALYSKQQKIHDLLRGKIENLLQMKASILDSAFKGEI